MNDVIDAFMRAVNRDPRATVVVTIAVVVLAVLLAVASLWSARRADLREQSEAESLRPRYISGTSALHLPMPPVADETRPMQAVNETATYHRCGRFVDERGRHV